MHLYSNSFGSDRLSWDINPNDKMIIDIKYDGKKVMGISLHEAIESSSRKQVLRHIKECDNTPWLKNWHEEAMDQVVDILKGKP